MKILVTGGTGFVGGAAVRRYLDRGHDVAILTRSGESPEGTAAIRGSLAAPPWKAIETFAPEACLHAAWITKPGDYLEAPENRDWLHWSRDFFEGLVSRVGVRRIVGLGTCIEYTASDAPALCEDAPTGGNPWLYARCKDELRRYLEEQARGWNISWAWGRVFHPYGPGENPKRLCSSLIEKLGRGEELVLKTPDSAKDYIYIDDLGEAIRRVTEAGRFNGCINLGTGHGVSVRELGRAIAQLLGRDKALARDAEEIGIDPLPRVVADVSKLEKLGLEYRYSLEDGLREIIARLSPDR